MMKIKKGIKKQKKGKVILVIDSGGRGHALAWKIAQSDDVKIVYCAPGNAGTAKTAKCINVKIAVDDISGLLEFAKGHGVDLAVAGSEVPLVHGITDIFENNGIPVFGPSMLGAMMEGSKEKAKKIMIKYGIKTASYKAFTDPKKAKQYIDEIDLDGVIKADGLTGGKGVTIYDSLIEAYSSIDEMMVKKIYSKAGEKILIEKRLKGREVSFFCFTDGKSIKEAVLVEDYKQLCAGDEGPNTGGMGGDSPPDNVSLEEKKLMKKTARRLIHAMRKEGIRYKGILYIGFMIVDGVAYVLEINCRFGDPECQLIMRRYKSDIVPVLFACTDGTLKNQKIVWDKRVAIGVVLASNGYPGKFQDMNIVSGLGQAARMEDIVVFHSGTVLVKGKILTKGGRNFTVTSLKKKKNDAIKAVYAAIGKMSYFNAVCRTDIGKRRRKG